MKKKINLLCLGLLFILGACEFSNSSFSNEFSSSESSESSFSSHKIRSSKDTSSETSSSTSSDKKSSSSKEETSSSVSSSIEESLSSSSSSSSTSLTSSSSSINGYLGTLSIKEVKEKCLELVKDVNAYNVGVNQTYTVTIEGKAISKFSLVKTKKAFGLDVSAPGKVILGDQTDYIACASVPGSDGTSLYGKVADYVNADTSFYRVKGYLSIYLGKPELYVNSKDMYSYEKDLNVSFSSFDVAKKTIDADEFYSLAKNINYNCAGHGYDEIYNLKDVKCVEKGYKGESYCFTDGKYLFKVIPLKAGSFSVGTRYDLSGMLTLSSYSPALRIIEYKVSNETSSFLEDYKIGKELSISDLKKIKVDQDDTDKKFPDFIECFKYTYKTSVYVSSYLKNSSYYVTVSDSFDSGTSVLTQESAHNSKGMVDIENNNYWNVSEEEITSYTLFASYYNVETAVEIYYSAWQARFLVNKATWKILLLVDLMNVNLGD